MITCSFCTPRDANWQSRANFLMPAFSFLEKNAGVETEVRKSKWVLTEELVKEWGVDGGDGMEKTGIARRSSES